MKSSDVVTEGRAKIQETTDGEVFYNDQAAFNRSLGVGWVKAVSDKLGRSVSVAEALAASGVRGIRYALESGEVDVLFLNDASTSAAEAIEGNVELNDVPNCTVTNREANDVLSSLYAKGESFDFVDVDPFGSFAPFVDNAVLAARRGTLALTATDIAPMCQTKHVAALRKYGGYSVRCGFCHELGLRIMVASALSACGRKETKASVLTAVFTEQYARILLSLSPGAMTREEMPLGYVKMCPQVHSVDVSEMGEPPKGYTCDECGSMRLLAGPLWTGDLHDERFLERLEESAGVVGVKRHRRRIRSLVETLKGEIGLPPYFFELPKAASRVGRPTPPVQLVIDSLEEAGYSAARTHFSPTGVKTDSPAGEFLELIQGLDW